MVRTRRQIIYLVIDDSTRKVVAGSANLTRAKKLGKSFAIRKKTFVTVARDLVNFDGNGRIIPK